MVAQALSTDLGVALFAGSLVIISVSEAAACASRRKLVSASCGQSYLSCMAAGDVFVWL